ncbi:MAG: 2Fe-2S iron-sulfur cluster-binding protein [Acidovorax sp.]|jgi:2Fe-2S ferredoxin
MTTITVLPSGKSYEVAAGTTILKALLGVGEPVMSKCDGNAKCEACHVFVTSGRKSLSRIQPLENEKLDGMVGIGSASRLACQAVLGEDPITVELLMTS